MDRRRPLLRLAGCLLAVVTLLGACASTAPATFEQFAAEHCAALQSLFRAYGNPDTAGMSPLMQSFADAIARGDSAAATAKASDIRAEMEGGRAHARAAAAWVPAGAAMAQLDRLFVAFERLVEVRLAAIAKGAAAAERDGQAAFETAGGAEAWRGWISGLQEAVALPGGRRSLPKCEGVPIS